MGKKQEIESLTQQLRVLSERASSLEAENTLLSKRLSMTEETARLFEEQQKAAATEAYDRSKRLLGAATIRARQILSDAEEAAERTRSQARTDAATVAVQTNEAILQRQSLLQDALAFVAQQNELYSADIRRRSLALMSAVRETTVALTRLETAPADWKALFASNLSRALLDAEHTDGVARGDDARVVRIPDLASFLALGSYGFRSSASLESVSLPEGVETLPESFFFGCGKLREVLLPKSLLAIDDFALFGCSSLPAVELPRELERIGEYAFSSCDALSSIRIPGGVKSIGVAAFRNCGALAHVELVKDGCLRELGSHAFQECAMLQAITLPKELVILPTSAFFGCASLQQIDIPANVSRMEADVFLGCTSLERVSFHSSNLLLLPNATDGLEHAKLTLAGKRFPWRKVEEPIKLKDLIASAQAEEADEPADGSTKRPEG